MGEECSMLNFQCSINAQYLNDQYGMARFGEKALNGKPVPARLPTPGARGVPRFGAPCG
jgi:hypothetical protein